ncbi:MAG: sarcosine oxidase subunit gamma family protein [Pseudomonadota bacterium]
MSDVQQVLERIHPLSGRVFAGAGVAITLAPSAFRLILRCGSKELKVVGDALGLELPRQPNHSAMVGNRFALWLGPDEWLVADPKVNPISALSDIDVAHSAVDISYRNTAVLVSGPSSAAVINAGCPRDLSAAAFPVGYCARTVFGKVEIVLFHVRDKVYRIEVWRSFSDYLFTHLETAARAMD